MFWRVEITVKGCDPVLLLGTMIKNQRLKPVPAGRARAMKMEAKE